MKNAPPLRTIDDYLVPVDVHDALRAPRGGIATCIVGLVAFFCELLVVYAVVKGEITVVGAILLHTVIVLVLAVYAWLLTRSARENRFAKLLLIATAASGPYGAAGLVLATLLYWFFANLASPFGEWYDTMFPRLPMSQAERIYTDIKIGRDESEKVYSVIPFLDVLAFGKETEKRQALAKMASNFHPTFAPVLRKALGDPSNHIRVQAAVAITKIEQQFLDRQMQLEAVEKLHPEDPIVLLALAKHYDNYAYTGLLDANRESANRENALRYYKQYLQRKTDDIEVRAHVGRLLMRSGDYKEAAEWLRQCIDLGYGSPAIAQWYAEALFAGGRFSQLREYSHGIPAVSQEHASFQPALKETIDLWKSAGGKA